MINKSVYIGLAYLPLILIIILSLILFYNTTVHKSKKAEDINLICSTCQSAGLRSTIKIVEIQRPKGGSFYDEDGKFHPHYSSSICRYKYRCSNIHYFNGEIKNVCYECCDCGWPSNGPHKEEGW